MKLLKLYKKAGIIVFLLPELILFSAITPNFLSGSNFINLLRQIAMLGIASIGISFLMIGGASADLSIAGQIPVLSMLCGIFMMWMNLPVPVAMLLTIAAGILLGYFNGMVIRILKINPFVVTLSTMTILQGVALLLPEASVSPGCPEAFPGWGRAISLAFQPRSLCWLCASPARSSSFQKRISGARFMQWAAMQRPPGLPASIFAGCNCAPLCCPAFLRL